MKELRDQFAHFTAAFIVIALVLAFPSVWICGIAGFCFGLIREITEEGGAVTLDKISAAITGSVLDLTFWTLGGAAAFHVIKG